MQKRGVARETTFADSSQQRAICSTTWLGDHFPGARGVVQVAADLSAAAASSLTAARLAASTSFTSAMGPPVRESVIDLNEPANLRLSCRRGQVLQNDDPMCAGPLQPLVELSAPRRQNASL